MFYIYFHYTFPNSSIQKKWGPTLCQYYVSGILHHSKKCTQRQTPDKDWRINNIKKNLCQQKMIGIWAERPLWPSFTHLKERRLLLDTLPWEIPCNLPPCLNITLPLYTTKPNRGIDGDIGFLKENYESQLKIDIQFFSYTFSRILLWLRGFVDINSKAMAHFVTIL